MMKKITQNAALRRINNCLEKRNHKVVKLKQKQSEYYQRKYAIINDKNKCVLFISNYLTPWLVEEWLLDKEEYIENELDIKLEFYSS
ncbi:TPA: hypothetical protein HNO27_24200 [Escherichia coli]|nr:hypothetical protein [Escherichia coli]HAJ7257699.1 hypothetical protein [Escherichia coli]HAJ7262527.1 hypothetical protein [Escherichia coli]HBA2641040.1 hypothetical protein [Escherichia coli]